MASHNCWYGSRLFRFLRTVFGYTLLSAPSGNIDECVECKPNDKIGCFKVIGFLHAVHPIQKKKKRKK